MAILGAPLLGAALLTALYMRMATAALPSLRADARVTLQRAQSPCALCRGSRAGFVEKEPREAKFLADPFGLVRSLAEEKPSRGLERSLAEEKPSRGLPGLESLVLGGARQAWRA